MRTMKKRNAEKEILERGALWEKLFNYAAVLAIGVALGYGWCWMALN